MTSRRTGTAAILVVVLAACGSSRGGASSEAPAWKDERGRTEVLHDVERTIDGGTARVTSHIERKAWSTQDPWTATLEGSVDLRNGDAALRTTAGDDRGASGDDAESAADASQELRRVGSVIYRTVPEGVQAELHLTDWSSIDLRDVDHDDVARQFVADPTVFLGDPGRTLDFLIGVREPLSRVGNESLSSVETVHYSGVLDLARPASEAAKDIPAPLRERLEVYGSDATTRIKSLRDEIGAPDPRVDVWVDRDGRLRKVVVDAFREDASYYDGSDSEPPRFRITTEFHAFGERLRVEAPPADEVTDALEYNAERDGSAGDEPRPTTPSTTASLQCKTEENTLLTAMEAYYARHSAYPTSEAELVAESLLEKASPSYDIDPTRRGL